jgi:hypothetical protein
MKNVNEFTQGMAKRWLTVDEVYDWFCYAQGFKKYVVHMDFSRCGDSLKEQWNDSRKTNTFAEFCDHVVLHRNVRIV